MKDELRWRRERHLYLLRLGVPYQQRVERLAEQFGKAESTIRGDEARMDEWIEDVATTASFQKKAAFLLHQHRKQTEGLEQLAENARQHREQAEGDVEGLRERIAEVETMGPEGFEDESDYWNTVIRLYQQLDSAKADTLKWAQETRHLRNDAAETVESELEARQSIGEVEQVADELHVREEREVTERKVIAGLDLNELPGMEEAQVIGADPDLDTDAATIDFKDND